MLQVPACAGMTTHLFMQRYRFIKGFLIDFSGRDFCSHATELFYLVIPAQAGIQ
jgi:hypothetical protein